MFKFTATTADRYTIETGGQTDVVMKLFGPGSKTDLIAEDDDGGAGQNSRIVADLSRANFSFKFDITTRRAVQGIMLSK